MLLAGRVAMPISPVEAGETQAGKTAAAPVYRDMFRFPPTFDSRRDQIHATATTRRTSPDAAQPQGSTSRGVPAPGRTEQRSDAVSPVLRLPPVDTLRTPDSGPEKIVGQEQVSSESSSRRKAARPLPQHVTADREHQNPVDLAAASRTAASRTAVSRTAVSDAPALTTRVENVPSQEPPARPSRSPRGTQKAADQFHRAMKLAEKGALYAAEEQLIQTLWLIAQSGDEADGSQVRGEALAAALQAWRKAEDLAPALGPSTTDAQVARLIAAHRTPLPKNASVGSVPAVDVLQAYYAFSQERLLKAVGHEPVASQVLYGLGRLQTAPNRISTPEQRLAGAKAIAMLQSALDVDDRNYAAANELGVLLARCGRLEEAKAAFLQAVSVAPAMEAWQNLATVGERIGDAELSKQAQLQYHAAREKRARGEATSVSGSLPEIRWVTLATFAGAPPEAGVAGTDPRPPVAPNPAPSAESKVNGGEGGFKDLFGWLPGRKAKSPTPQPSPPTTTALRNVPNHLTR